MTTPMRSTVRQARIKRAYAQAEPVMTALVAQSLDRQYKALKRDLRRGNLHKRLSKAAPSLPDDLAKGIWPDWIKSFAQGIKDALGNFVQALQNIEVVYWDSYGKVFDPTAPASVIDAYEARVGRQIVDIAESVKNDALTEIAKWYDSGQPFSDLLTSLGQYFSEARAETIARTELSFLQSQVARNAMEQQRIEKFNVVLAPDDGPWPCATCVAQAEANPHNISDDMPPYHPRDRCGVEYVMDDILGLAFAGDKYE